MAEVAAVAGAGSGRRWAQEISIDRAGSPVAHRDRLGEDEQLRVGVLYSTEDHFSAGLDIEQLAPLLEASAPELLAGSGRYDPLGPWKPPVPKPVVMAVNGVAFTLAIELAPTCDVVVAADDVRFCQLEVARGIFAFEGGSFRAPLQLGWGNAMRFLLTSEEFGAAEALHIGLVQEGDLARRSVAQTAVRPLGERGSLASAR